MDIGVKTQSQLQKFEASFIKETRAKHTALDQQHVQSTGVLGTFRAANTHFVVQPSIHSLAGAPAANGIASSQPTSEENMQPQSGGASHAPAPPQHTSASQPTARHQPAAQMMGLTRAPDQHRKAGTGIVGKGGEKTCGLCGEHPPSKPEQCKYCRKCSEDKGRKPNRARNTDLWVLRSACPYKGNHPKDG